DVAKDDHHSDELTAIVEDWGGGQLNRVFLLCATDQDQDVREYDHALRAANCLDRIVDFPTSLFINNRQNLPQRPSLSICIVPARELLGDGIEERHSSRRVS